MKSIMLACNAGMSTSMLVARMKEAAKKQGLEYDIFAVPLSEVSNHVAAKDVQVILVGPQVKHVVPDLKKQYEPGIVVEAIDMRDYGMMDGEKVLKTALSYMEE